MKERKISRRAVCSAMVASLALGVLEGCGSSSSTTSSAAGSGAAASNERITVRILKSKAANEVAAEQMDVWKVLGEKFNMDFEFDNPPQDNYNERLNLVMMDAQLPDIIMDMPTTEVLKYGESGVILSLNDYIENNMPNLKKEIDKRDGVEKALTYSDGNIYYMPMLDEKVSGNMPYIVRTDWLEKLGIESPVTLEDWENYWHLVKTTDLNGNGTNDEIPFSSYDMTGLRNFCTAFGCLDDFYTDPDDGGKVHYGPIDPKYKKAVTWMHDMYEKGYIDPEIITMDYASFACRSWPRTRWLPSTARWAVCWLHRTPPCLPPSPASMLRPPYPPRAMHRSTPILIRSRVPLQPPPSPQAARTLTAWSLCWTTCTAKRAPY